MGRSAAKADGSSPSGTALLDLDDRRWAELTHAYGSAADIPPLLRHLREFPPATDYRAEPYFSLWTALCHQGPVYPASYAAVPHLVAALLASTSPVYDSPTSMIKVPDKLKPGANESLAMIVPAKGVRIYECRARKDQVGGFEWAFVAPEADLFERVETESADTMPAPIGNRPMAARSWVR